jgi:hypothetical protein
MSLFHFDNYYICVITQKKYKMKNLNLLATLLVLIFILSSGCSEENTTEPTPTNSAPLAKLSDIQSKVFNTTCALSGCHGATNNQANLLLTDGNAFSNLVNVQSVVFPQFKRVVADSSSKSLIIKILKGEVSPRMPFNRDPLPAATIDSIAKWIDNGALNN